MLEYFALLCSGLDNSGKTTIVLKINGEDTSVISPTLGFNIKTITYQKYTLNIWDVGGQKTIRSYWRNYFEQTDSLVWVVDNSDLRRLDDCKMELDNLLKEERLSGASLLILANKQDIKVWPLLEGRLNIVDLAFDSSLTQATELGSHGQNPALANCWL
nr:adp-ribosylation factor-like protein 2 [Quercus suber]